jgi:hypothetical protein
MYLRETNVTAMRETSGLGSTLDTGCIRGLSEKIITPWNTVDVDLKASGFETTFYSCCLISEEHF